MSEREQVEAIRALTGMEAGAFQANYMTNAPFYNLVNVVAPALAAAREENGRLREGLEAIALGVAAGNRGFDVTWAELSEAALAGREPEGARAMSWLAAARRAAHERAAIAEEDGNGR